MRRILKHYNEENHAHELTFSCYDKNAYFNEIVTKKMRKAWFLSHVVNVSYHRHGLAPHATR